MSNMHSVGNQFVYKQHVSGGMIYFNGFNDFFTKGSECNVTEFDEDILKIAASWCNILMMLGGGTLKASGYQCDSYNRLFKEVGTTRDMTFVDNNMTVVNTAGNVFMITDKHKSPLNVTFDKNNVNGNQICRLAATDTDLVFISDTKTCFISENIVSFLDTKEQMKNVRTTVSLPVSMLSPDIVQVSCGKEHVLLLTTYGTVLSYGGGSRGQLGDGTVESKKEAKIVEYLAGLKISKVAAGGWHSLCISECGDVYCWGWNESGQLGLPSNSVREKHQSTNISKHTNDGTDTKVKQEPHPEPPKDNSLKYNLHSEEKQDRETSICIDKFESLLFIQNVDPVQVQSFPCLLDLNDQITIQQASCGSRHTALLTDDGVLLTAGWNDYRQLCQGDEITRDYFETAKFYTKCGTKIKDVYCGPWSTFAIT